MRVAVIGGSEIGAETRERAVEVGRLLGERGHAVVCGGLSGVMEAVCKGASETGAETIGILPGEDRDAANEWVTTPIATGLGHARNPLVVCNGDAVVAIDGAAGTLSELGHALVFHRPIAGLGTHEIELEGFEAVETPTEAVEHVEGAIEERSYSDD
ncbi:MAG: TIGR00725 family protein [Halobacteriota archaeon]|uniref:TIGR00725 family protein n=1 Tax=Natronomonas sp. TaxID=2184060 RepID=UPI00397710C7